MPFVAKKLQRFPSFKEFLLIEEFLCLKSLFDSSIPNLTRPEITQADKWRSSTILMGLSHYRRGGLMINTVAAVPFGAVWCRLVPFLPQGHSKNGTATPQTRKKFCDGTSASLGTKFWCRTATRPMMVDDNVFRLLCSVILFTIISCVLYVPISYITTPPSFNFKDS